MKLVLTFVAHDEADVVEHQVRYHLEAGVDLLLATDHRSSDGTTEILERYERDGHLRLFRQPDKPFFQSAWVTEMAQLAAVEHGADWVINSDADEFWWARDGTLKEVLAAVPHHLDVVRGLWRHFVLRPDDDGPFYERMIVRRRPATDPLDPYHAQTKVAHRADPQAVVSEGNHDVSPERLKLVREWFPFEVLHFPVRSKAHLERKYVDAWEGHRLAADSPPPRHIEAAARAAAERRADDVYRDFLVDDAELERGLADGTYALDTRLRDALRGVPAAPATPVDDAELAEEIDAFLLSDSARRVAARASALEQRVAAVEGAVAVRVSRSLSQTVS